MRILITGGCGYIGSVLTIKAIMAGHHVAVLDNLLYGQGHTQAHLAVLDNRPFVVDVRDVARYRDLITWADAVVHLAAIVGAPACDKHRDLATSVNVDATRLLVSQLSKSQRLIYPNTNSGYGTVTDGICTEETPIAPLSHYGRTKQAGEVIAMAHLAATTLRLATVFGVSPRMRLDLLVNQFVYRAWRDRRIEVFDGDLWRNFVHIKDVTEIILELLERPETNGQVYNLGSDSMNMTKRQLADRIADAMHSTVVIGVGSDPDKRDYRVSSQKLADLGIVACRWDVDGLLEVADWLPRLAGDDYTADRMNTTCTHRPCAGALPSPAGGGTSSPEECT